VLFFFPVYLVYSMMMMSFICSCRNKNHLTPPPSSSPVCWQIGLTSHVGNRCSSCSVCINSLCAVYALCVCLLPRTLLSGPLHLQRRPDHHTLRARQSAFSRRLSFPGDDGYWMHLKLFSGCLCVTVCPRRANGSGITGGFCGIPELRFHRF
jgi:hypothetical protein